MQTKRCLIYLGFLLVVIIACCQAQSLLKTFKGTTRPPSIDEGLKLKSNNNTLTSKNKANQKTAEKLSSKNANNNVNNVDNDDDDDDNDENNGANEDASKKNSKSKQNTKPPSKGSKNSKQKESGKSKTTKKPSPPDDDNDDNDDNNGNDAKDKDKDDDDDDDDDNNDDSSTTTAPEPTTTSNDNDNNNNENCTAPSINDFPADLFTQTQRRFGGVLFHVAFAAYLFLAIMVVCDDYFMTSLEIIGQNLNLDQDVAGATFMAAGSSAPEVFISLVGIIVGESNPGIGAIVGSAIFNILFVVGLCGLFVLGTAKLTMWPFFRDAVFYCVAILLLVLLIRDDKVYWYESFVLLAFYGVYIFFMMNNDRFKNMAYEKFKILQQEAQSILPGGLSTTGGGAPHNKQFGFLTARRSISKSQSGYNRFNDDDDQMYAWGGTLENIAGHANTDNYSYQNSAGGGGGAPQQIGTNKQGIDMNMLRNADSLVASNTRQIDFDTAALQIMLSSRYYFRPKTRFRMAVRRVIDEILWIKRTSAKKTQVNMSNFDLNPLNKQNYALFLTDVPNINEPGGRLNFVKWAVMVPARVLFYFTMPDCRVEKYKKWYWLTFGVSILWLAVLSYLIIWMITVIGYTLGIPDSLMAVTLVAAGTSIPDAYTSVVVVKEGMVDMGVSNIIGSNVFDLLIGLALPWFIKSIFNNGYVIINSNGLVYDSLLLYACVFATICVIHIRKWNLDRRTGYLFLSIYSAFIIFSSAIELNVFSYVNPPMCS